jgi:hypothetical protein
MFPHQKLLVTSLAILLLMLYGCRKEKKDFMLDITGTLSEGFSNQPLEKAKVSLYVKEITGSMYSGMFRKKEETETDAQGNFSFRFDRGDAVEYRLEYSKDGYFSFEQDFDSNSLKPDKPFSTTAEIFTKSTVSIYLSRSNSNGNGYFRANGRSKSNLECCGAFTITSTLDVDTLIVREIYGNQYYYISHLLATPPQDNLTGNDSVFCPAFQSVNYSIQYDF